MVRLFSTSKRQTSKWSWEKSSSTWHKSWPRLPGSAFRLSVFQFKLCSIFYILRGQSFGSYVMCPVIDINLRRRSWSLSTTSRILRLPKINEFRMRSDHVALHIHFSIFNSVTWRPNHRGEGKILTLHTVKGFQYIRANPNLGGNSSGWLQECWVFSIGQVIGKSLNLNGKSQEK